MTWFTPEAFWFLPLILVAIFFFWKVSVRFRSRLVFPFDWSGGISKKILSPFRMQGTLRFFAFLALMFALARPQRRQEKEKRIVESIDLLIDFDLSKSMEAIDFTPNRRTVAIDTLTQFIKMRPDDRLGLVLFSGEAYLSVPLTNDHKALMQTLQTSSNAALEDGTAIGQALAVSVNHLRTSTAKSRVILLVTDGDNNMGSVDPVSAAQMAAGYGIRIYTIGLGKKGRVAFPVMINDGFGQKRQVYQYLTDAVNDELLQKISDLTGGKYYKASDQNLLNGIYDDINHLEKSKVEILKQVKVIELADVWIWLAIVLLLSEGFALQTKWRKFP